MIGWDFRIRGFAGSKHPNKAPWGSLLQETTHTGLSSAQIEIQAWGARMERDEVCRVELIDLRLGGRMTNLKINAFNYKMLDWK